MESSVNQGLIKADSLRPVNQSNHQLLINSESVLLVDKLESESERSNLLAPPPASVSVVWLFMG